MPTHVVFACSQTGQLELSVSISKLSVKADRTMANKENMSPRADAGRYLRDGSTPPGNLPGTLGIRHWQQSALNHSPPFAMLSPNSKPSLARQRDHSACRKTDSPLKVRKTRENLKQASIYADIAPPCIHSVNDDGCLSLGPAPPPIPKLPAATDCVPPVQFDSGSTLTANTNDGYPVEAPATTPAKMLRHKSVSRRMLSKVKEGIAHRSRSSHSMRSTEHDAGLIRRISNRRKQSSEEQREHSRLRSFEVSRDSIESQDLDVDTSGSQRSFTDSSIDELMGSATLMTPPSMMSNTRPAPDRQFSDRLLSPSPTPRSPTPDPTPRPNSRFLYSAVDKEIADLQATVPYMDLKISLDRDSVDVGLARDVWVAIEATVRTKAVEANSSSTYSSTLRSRPLDAIIVIDHNIPTNAGSVAHQCIVELCSRLDIPGDKLAVLSARQRTSEDAVVGCECALLHALMPPSTALVLERLGLVPSTTGEDSSDHIPHDQFLPMQQLFRTFLDQGLQHESVQVFIISRAPSSLVQAIGSMVNWAVHTLKIELGSDENATNVLPARHNWALDFRGTADVNADLLDNMFRDLRHGCSLGGVTSLRLCFKPLERCRILEVIGQKAVKDLRFGQRTSLFLKVHVPRIQTSEPAVAEKDNDTESLFVELESMLGTLESNFLHVEARYRHTALPTENVVTVREICTIKRPKTDSRWSIIGDATSFATQSDVHTKLAQFLATYYSPNRALKMIDRWTLQQSTAAAAVQQVRRFLEGTSNKDAQPEDESWTATSLGGDKPSVVITDIDTTTANSSTKQRPSSTTETSTQHPSTTLDVHHPPSKLPASPSAATIISAPKTTTAITLASEEEDSARQIWRHLRRNSQSAQQMLELSPEHIEANDDTGMVKMLRDKALANKRSVGAETLKGWRWEGNRGSSGAGGEAPWL